MKVVFIVTDTVRRDYLSPFNNDIDCTENIQQVADEGTVFKEAVAQGPWTLPSHGSMFTGLYPWEHGATQTNLNLDVNRKLLAERLNEEGYRTACYSANPFISGKFGTVDGFEETELTVGLIDLEFGEKVMNYISSLEEKLNLGAIPRIEKIAQKLSYRMELMSEKDTERLVRNAKEFMQENRENDFFVFMNLMDCHLPLFPKREYLERHAEGIDPSEVAQHPHRVIPSEEEPESEALKKLYKAQIDYLDDQIGRITSFLEEENLKEDTMLVIASDHGENLGEEGLIGHWFSVNEKLVNVPLIIDSPSMDEGVVKKQVELRELYDLILEQTGVKKDYDIGVKYAKGGQDRPEMDLTKIPTSERQEHDKKRYYIRTREKKGVITSEGEFKEVELRAGDEIRSSVLKKKCEGLKGSYDESSEGNKIDSVDQEVKKELEKLGYVG